VWFGLTRGSDCVWFYAFYNFIRVYFFIFCNVLYYITFTLPLYFIITFITLLYYLLELRMSFTSSAKFRFWISTTERHRPYRRHS